MREAFDAARKMPPRFNESDDERYALSA